MEAKAELAREIDTEQEEEKVVEWGEVSEETRGGVFGFFLEAPCGGGRTNWPCP